MEIIIFGAGINGQRFYNYVKNSRLEMQILAVVDNFAEGTIGNFSILRPNKLQGLIFDRVYITNTSLDVVCRIKHQLIELGIPSDKLYSVAEDKDLMNKLFSEYNGYDEQTDFRVRWLRNFAEYVREEKLEGNVAECGVFMGEFSYYINKYFMNKTLYLFDTFSGFAEADIVVERKMGNQSFINGQFNGVGKLANTSEQIVINKMLYPEKCIIKKGYFPETADGLCDRFCLVVLDMDLYQPMFSGLEFFYKKMVQGGVILLHDYFHSELPGVKKAVEDFEERTNQVLCKIPIGDFCSIAIVKK